MAKYMDSGGLSHLMSKIKAAIAATVTGVKGNAESTYRTGQVNITAANVGALGASDNAVSATKLKTARTINVGNKATGTATSFDGSANITVPVNSLLTDALVEPSIVKSGTKTSLPLVDTLKGNKLALLPADQIIIEKTTDGGTTWTDAGISDWNKRTLFLGNTTAATIPVPLLNGNVDTKCGLRITFTSMKYNVPEGTAETGKYAYWNSTYVASTERYGSLQAFYIFVSSGAHGFSCKCERAAGNAPNTWTTVFNKDSQGDYLTGWSGGNYIAFGDTTFGGGTNQVSQPWNWRLTFFLRGTGANGAFNQNYLTQNTSVMRIAGYGANIWVVPNNLAGIGHLYTWDNDKNATFPAWILPASNNSQYLGSSSYKWANVYATTLNGNLTGNVTGNVTGNLSGTAQYADKPTGFSWRSTSMAWGNQTGTVLTCLSTPAGGGLGFRDNNPSSGQVSMTIDGTVYVKEGMKRVLDESDLPLSIANGGTGQTSAVNAANSFLNALSTGSSDPVDADYYISQYANGGSTTTTYHRRPMSALWNYVKGKISSILGLTASQYGGNAATATTAGNVTGTVAIANGGTGATSAANARTNLGVPPTSHASTATTYGAGTDANYGHVKLSDATNGTSTVSGGTAATPKAVSDALVAAKTYADGKNNQNAFSNFKVGSTTVAADTTTDTLELAGSNVTVTPDATNDKVTIGITASNVTTALGNTAVARATADASGNNIASTYANQNAFSNVKVGSTTVAADTTTDTLELAGSNVTLTPDATNDKVTVGITASNVMTALGNTAVARATADASGNTITSTYVNKSGDTMTGNLVVPMTRIANTYYGVSFGRTTGTPVETILYTGIKWVSGAHMPVVHVTGYAYGLNSPVEFKIGFYLYSNKVGWCGATNMGSWNPGIKLFKHTVDNVDYVAVGFSGSCYFLQLQVDVQDEMGKFGNINLTSSLWSWSFLATTGTIPEADGGVTCIEVPYKADILAPPVNKATGTLAIAHGGTGATTADAAWTALGGGAIGKKASLAATDIPSHASTATTYGVGTNANYGHLKLSDSTSSSSGTSGGIAATPSAVKTAYDLANTANGTANTALSGVNGTLIYDHTYTIANGVATFTAHVYCKGEEVTSQYADSAFSWSYRLSDAISETGTPSVVSLGTGKTKTINITTLGLGGHVIGTFTTD